MENICTCTCPTTRQPGTAPRRCARLRILWGRRVLLRILGTEKTGLAAVCSAWRSRAQSVVKAVALCAGPKVQVRQAQVLIEVKIRFASADDVQQVLRRCLGKTL